FPSRKRDLRQFPSSVNVPNFRGWLSGASGNKQLSVRAKNAPSRGHPLLLRASIIVGQDNSTLDAAGDELPPVNSLMARNRQRLPVWRESEVADRQCRAAQCLDLASCSGIPYFDPIVDAR